MCGHVGVAGDLRYDDEKLMKKLLLFDYFRGMDSTGLAVMRKNGECQIVKVADNPLILFDTMRFKAALSGSASQVFMGHNRAATRGGISNANAHPFQVDHIIGTHNGTLTLNSTRQLEKALGQTFPVDSLALFAAIARLGIEETMALCETGTTYHDGAWSLVWIDRNQGSLNFLRNKHRPMYYAFTEDYKRIIWGSEYEIIRSALTIGENVPEKLAEDKEGYSYLPTDEDVLYSFDIELLKQGKGRPKPKVKKLPGKEPVVVSSYAPAKDDPFEMRGGQFGMGFHGTQTSMTTSRSKEKDVIHLVGDNDNPLAGTVKKADFEAMAKFGCAWCSADVAYDDEGIIVIEKDNAVLCAECSGDIDVTRVYAKSNLIDILVNS